MTEQDAEAFLAHMLEGDAVAVERQVAVGLKHTDIVVLWPSSPAPIEAIEVKLRDWRRAAHQAYLSATYADRASIALPVANASAVDVDYLAALGVGLILFDETGWTRALEPRADRLPASVRAAMMVRIAGIAE